MAELRKCVICAATALEEIPEFASLPRVTSDCIPFPNPGKLATCESCGAAQAIADQAWFSDIGEIYDNYRIYHQSGGVEQHVLDPRSGGLRKRSEVLLERLAELPGVPHSGKILDVGCGTGGTLRAFADRGGWALYGLEMDERNLSFLTAIPGFQQLYTCAPEAVPLRFDVVTMVHALEHFPEPTETLRSLLPKLAPAGRLFVQVPNAAANPFDYLVADHMTHFTAETLAVLAENAGLTVDCVATDWVKKELSLVARAGDGATKTSRQSPPEQAVQRVRRQVKWLYQVMDYATSAAAENGTVGLFGASIAATWLYGCLGDRVAFFVEEDPHRIGRTHMGRPILAPAQVSPGSVVFVPLIPAIASVVRDRLADHDIDIRLPPPFL